MFTEGCKSKYDIVVRLDEFDAKTISFQDLPKDVQEIYLEFVKTEHLKDTIINRMDNKKIELFKPTLHDNQFELVRDGFNHVFIVDDSIAFKLKANKGDPFVFYDGSLFYSDELNLDPSNVKYSEYKRIDLDEFFYKSN